MSYIVNALDANRPQPGDDAAQLTEELRAIKARLVLDKAAQEANLAFINGMGNIVSRNLTSGTIAPNNADGVDGDIYLQYVV